MTAKFGSIDQLPSGRYRARYYDNGKLLSAKTTKDGRPLTFRTKAEANAWLAERGTQALIHSHRPAETIKAEAAAKRAKAKLFGAFAREAIAARDLKVAGRAQYEDQLAKYILPTFELTPLGAISKEMISKWYGSFLGDRTGKATTGKSIRANVYGLLGSIMNDAVRLDFIDANPCTIRGGAKKKRAHIPIVFTVEELNAVAAAMPEKWSLLILMSCWGALRKGEVTALRRGNVSADGMEVSIHEGAIRVKGKGMVSDTPKTDAGIRKIAMPAPLAAMIVDHLAKFTGPEHDALLFPSATGKLLPTSTLYKFFYRARTAAGQPTAHFHDLRHTGATWAADAGATLAELMQRMGHTTATVAIIYQHATREGDNRIAEKLAGKMTTAASPTDGPAAQLAAALAKITALELEAALAKLAALELAATPARALTLVR